MVDPSKVPDRNDPNTVSGRSTVDPKNRPVRGDRRNYPWAWIIGAIIVLLLLWAYFGMGRRGEVVNPATGPAPAASVPR